MCLILFAYRSHPEYRLVVAANRDEFYDRPALPLSFWNREREILAGQDLKQKGTWLGITRTGRFAAVTNFREPRQAKTDAVSRGQLVSEFLSGIDTPEQYLVQIEKQSTRYNGFNLIVGDPDELFYYSNRGGNIKRLGPGTYGLSNHLLDTPWPKVKKGKERFRALLGEFPISFDGPLDMLKDQVFPSDELLPDTGAGIEWERILSPIFISSEKYGTRCSSVLWIDASGRVTFLERTYASTESQGKEAETRIYRFKIH